MSTNDYPNRDALRKANDIYLDVMRSFIIHNLRQVKGEQVEHLIEDVLYDNQVDQFRRMLSEHDDIESAVDFTYIPHIVKKYWDTIFGEKFEGDLVSQSVLWLIRKGRNRCEHRTKDDLEIEFTRTHLFLISDILDVINRPDKKSEVDKIRDEFLSDEATRQISEIEDQIENIETEKKEYKGKLIKANKRIEELEKEQTEHEKRIGQLEEIEKEKIQLEERNTKLSTELEETEGAWKLSEEHLKTKDKQLRDEIDAHNSLKEHISSLNEQIEVEKNEKDEYKKQLAEISREKADLLEQLSSNDNLLNILSIDNQTVKRIYPHLSTDSQVRVLDRRNTDKKSYLTNLLELKQPSIIYVDSEEKVNIFLTHIAGKKAASIGIHYGYISETEEAEMLEKLENGDFIAIVSNAPFSTIPEQHCIENFVFCHPILDIDDFYKQCQPAFVPIQKAYLHFIYDTMQDFQVYKEDLVRKYPDEDTLREFYKEIRALIKSNGECVNHKLLSDELDIKNGNIETGIAIFHELGLIEKTEDNIKLIENSDRKELDASRIYSEGEKLRAKVNSETYQFGMGPIESIWEKIVENIGIENNQIIREQNDDVYETKNETRDERDTETTNEKDAEPTDTSSTRPRSKVNEEQVKDIRKRSDEGESLSSLGREFGISSTAIWNIVNRNTWKDVE